MIKFIRNIDWTTSLGIGLIGFLGSWWQCEDIIPPLYMLSIIAPLWLLYESYYYYKKQQH